MRKESSSNNKYFFTLTFLCRRIHILLENIFGKTQFILLHLYYIFFVWQVIRSVVIKHQRPYRYALVFRRSISTQNTWQQTRYFKVYFESNGLIFLFHIYISHRSTFNLEKNKIICSGKFLVQPIQETGYTDCRTVFQTMHISQRHVHNLERNQKNSVCLH